MTKHCVAYLKKKQHSASCKSKLINPITKPLFMLHIDLFGPTFVSSLMHKKYCLVITDDFSRFTWVFFLKTKDETSEILMNFIKDIENQVDKNVKIIRSDNGTEFKNRVMDAFCRERGIKREYSVARTPQQNRVAEKRNRTLIEAARIMLADSKLPTTFWVEAVSTACYVHNRILIVKPHYKTHCELFRGLKPSLSFMKPFGCHVTILNTLDSLGKFDGKTDDGFFVGYSLSSKAFRVYNTRTRKVEENLHIGFLKNKTMIEGSVPKWLFDIDSLTQSMNYVPVSTGTTTNESADTSYFDSSTKNDDKGEPKSVDDDPKMVTDDLHDDSDDNTVSPEVNTGGPTVNTASPEDMFRDDHSLEATHVEFVSDKDEPQVELGNIPNSYTVPTTPHTKIHKDHPPENVIEPNRVNKALSDPAWVEAMQEELLQFERQKVWILVDLPKGNRPIGLKWIFKNKTDERGIVIRNKARLVAQGHTQEEGIDYDDVFALVGRIEAIRLFLAYASFMGFMVYQMDVKSAFLYGKIEEEVYVCQPLGFEDPIVYKVMKALYGLHQAPRAWYKTLANYLLRNGFHRGKIDPTLFIKRQKEMCDDFEKLMKDKFQMSSMGELTFFLGLQVKQKKDGIFISQDKYVVAILRKFNYTDMKSTSTTIDLEKPFTKDGDVEDVDVHLYRSMILSLMYLTASRPDTMFAICVCARFQVTPKISHLIAVKRIFRYLKDKPTLGLWYARDSPFELVAYTDSDYAGATQDRKSTTGGCHFLGSMLISWQCKKQTIVATSTTEAGYVAAASCCGQFYDKQNMVAFLEKSTGIVGFHPAIDFFSRSHISYALIRKPEVYISFIKQFWRTNEATTNDDEEVKITATIDGQSKTITKASLRGHLKLEDHDGVEVIPNTEIFEQLALMGYNTDSDRIEVLEKDLQKTKQTYSTAFTKLILRVKKLETRVKTRRARRRARLVLSKEEHDSLDDSSKQRRKISDIDEDSDTYLAQDDGVEWIQEDTDMQEAHHKQSDDIKVIMQDQTPTEVIQDQGSAKRGQPEVSTAGIPVSTARVTTRTAEETPTVSTAHINISIASTIHREIRKVQKLLEQERLGYETAVRLQEQADEEKRAQIARDEEIAKQLAEQERLRAESEAKESKEID
ncbi:putative ribonuclease H-like domain-containing protein [Tanacetum coccineum]